MANQTPLGGRPPVPPPPPMMMMGPPPLPSGWTEHRGPQGQTYYYNAATKESTYIRPSAPPPPPMIYPGPPPQGFAPPMYGQPPPAFFSGPPPAPAAQAPVPDSKPAKKKKEKPREKLPIPGAEGWLRVTTTEDNVFYTHVERKESHWTVPEEIADAVRELERAEREEREKVAKEEKQAREKELEERRAKEEAEREELRRIREDIQREEQAKKEAEAAAQALKRKREGEEDGREGAPGGGSASPSPEEKRARVGSSEAAAAPDQDEGDDEDEEWQRAMAAEMAAEAADSSAQQPAPPGPPPAFPSAPAGAAPAFSPPPASTNVELSVDEAKALFLHMLSSLNNTPSEVNPMAPWDRELPKFVHHPNYTLLRTLRDRQDAFNEWCKLRLRQKRTAGPGAKNDHGRKASPANTPVAEVAAKAGERASSNEAGPSSGDASVAYRALLEAEVASTRTRWEDFRKAWKKDRRFFGFGRDEKEREKAFRAWLRELGERKRQAALAAESAFLSLLSEKLSSSTRDAARSAARTGGDDALNAAWREAKRAPGLDSDARYEAVGSSTRRAELFGAWARGEEGRSNTNGSASASKDPKREEQRSKGNERQEKERDAQRALKEREEQVRKQRARVEGQNRAAFGAATHEESVVHFKQLLVDAVRDTEASWRTTSSKLSSDPRFSAPGLSMRERESLFDAHISTLASKRRAALHRVFETHAPGLDAEAEDVLPLVKEDPAMERAPLLGLVRDDGSGKRGDGKREEGERDGGDEDGERKLREAFESWQRERKQKAREEFQVMLKENSFVEFWGRLRQSKNAGNETDVPPEEEGGEEEEVADLRKMAEGVDLKEVLDVVKSDKRYRAFNYIPEQRESWIREYLQHLAAPKVTVHQKEGDSGSGNAGAA